MQESLLQALDDFRAECGRLRMADAPPPPVPPLHHDRLWGDAAADPHISLRPVPGDEQRDGVIRGRRTAPKVLKKPVI